jgi:hypothetical protein
LGARLEISNFDPDMQNNFLTKMKKISINIGRCEEETKGGREKSQPSNRKNRQIKRKKDKA